MYSMQRHMSRNHSRPPKRKGKRFLTFLIVLGIGGLTFNYIRPLPHANASVAILGSEASSVKLKWPDFGSGAIGADHFGILATHGPQDIKPMASLAKLVTVLAVLEKHPLSPGKDGPTITMSAADEQLFNKYFSQGGAYVKIATGQKVTLYRALQAVLLPSANNMADTLAIWTFGSMDAYHAYANEMLKKLGLESTVVAGDASGFLPASKSTPGDLVRLGNIALKKPIIAEIVKQPSATFPGHGIIYSANSRLGYDGVIGIKTGLTDEAGGCFLFASKLKVKDKTAIIIGVITNAPTLPAALAASEPLVNSAKPYFSVKTPVKAGDIFATLTTPWLASSKVIAKQDITLLTWQGAATVPAVKVAAINRSLPAGAQVGTATIASGQNLASVPLVLEKAINGPSWQWRIKRF